MNAYIIDAIVALFILSYFVWSAFTVYFVMIGKKVESGATLIGKLIWYHGITLVFLMIGIAGLTAALLLSKYLYVAMRAQIFIGVF